MITDTKTIFRTGTVMVNFFLDHSLSEDSLISRVDIFFHEILCQDASKIISASKINFWRDDTLFLDDDLSQVAIDLGNHHYQIKFQPQNCKKNEKLWLSLNIAAPLILTKNIEVSAFATN